MKKVLYNGRMRTLHSGARGGHYVISSGRKVYLKVKSSSKKTGPKKKTSSALKKKTGPKKKTSSALKKKTGPKKKTSSALKKKTGPKKKTSSALKKKTGPKKKTSAAKRKPGPKKKSKRGFRMPRLFKGGGGNNEDIWQSIYAILEPGITRVVQEYPDTAIKDIVSVKTKMEEFKSQAHNMVERNYNTSEYNALTVKWETTVKPIAVSHFTAVIRSAKPDASQEMIEEMIEAIDEIASLSYWYEYINDFDLEM
jgi:hypothetical protein